MDIVERLESAAHTCDEGCHGSGMTVETMLDAVECIQSLQAENAALREALSGYRAAVAFVSADSWDGCSDCIDVLKAARCADMTEALTNDEIASNLARIRKHYPSDRNLPERTKP